MILPLEAYIDESTIEDYVTVTKGKTLTARLITKEQFEDIVRKERSDLSEEDVGILTAIYDNPIYLNLFEIPVDQFIDDPRQQLPGIGKREVAIGDIPTLKQYKTSEIEAELRPGYFYEILTIGMHENKTLLLGRMQVSSEKLGEGSELILDQLKLIAIEALGFSLEQAKDMKTEAAPMAGGLENKDGAFLGLAHFVGFYIGDDYTIHVMEEGSIDYMKTPSGKVL